MTKSISGPGRDARRAGRRCAAVIAALMAALVLDTTHSNTALAAGDLLVAPTRVVFEGRQRSMELTLVNKDTEPAVYRISVQNWRMLEDGRFEKIEEPLPGEQFATDLVRYAPRRIRLAPNEPQTIRIRVRKPAGLEAGEYRSHMLFRAVPTESGGQSVNRPGAEDGQLKVELIPVYGVSIPVIVRHGDLNAAVSVDAANLKPAGDNGQPPAVQVALGRQGERSIYGNIKISLLDTGGSEAPIGLVRGVAVYTPNPRRTINVPIDPKIAKKLKGRQVRVAFHATERDGGAVLSEKNIVLR